MSDGLCVIREEHDLPHLPSLDLQLIYNAGAGLAPDAEALIDVIREQMACA